MTADAAYCTYAAAEAAVQAGAVPFIDIKPNTTGDGGGALQAMFHYYSLRRDEFAAHYHKRSNVESTFSMIKAKFGDHLRSKSDTALINEALCKVLCHNVCCLIQSHYELGIAAAVLGSRGEIMDPSWKTGCRSKRGTGFETAPYSRGPELLRLTRRFLTHLGRCGVGGIGVVGPLIAGISFARIFHPILSQQLQYRGW